MGLLHIERNPPPPSDLSLVSLNQIKGIFTIYYTLQPPSSTTTLHECIVTLAAME